MATMVTCQGCGEETTSRLCCPKCSEFGRTSFFCSQDCFVSSWPSHSKLHVIIKQSAMTISVCSSDVFTEDGIDESSATTAASLPSSSVSTLSTRPSSLISSTDTPSYSRTVGGGADDGFPRPRSGPSATELPVVPSRSSLHQPSVLTSRGPSVPSDPGTVAKQPSSSAKKSTSPGFFGKVRGLLAGEGGMFGSSYELPLSVISRGSAQQRHAVRAGGPGALIDGQKNTGAFGSLSRATPSAAGRRCWWLLVCVFVCVIVSMWTMRRTLFDCSSQGGAFDIAQGDLPAYSSDSPTGRSAETTVVNSVLAQLGGRRYADELSALQESVQDLRNELAAVTTLVQQHAAFISQFVEKPTPVGRRQGGGAIKHAISASVEGPPLPDVPQLRFALADAEVASRSAQSANSGIERETARAGDGNTMGDGLRGINHNGGVLSQKSFGASVALESTVRGSGDNMLDGETRGKTADAPEGVERVPSSAAERSGGAGTPDADTAFVTDRGVDTLRDGIPSDDDKKKNSGEAEKEPLQADAGGRPADNGKAADLASSPGIKGEVEILSASGEVVAQDSREARVKGLEEETGAGRRGFLGVGGKGHGLTGGRLDRL
ncbi:putative transmembrane protein [Toxoplasma gondii GAB2-2007-GAL-DOM2]|uniref:Putative transmembrane protein n=2 Tax=Toxoplasma gondii TaxID=5811 RepID=A0A086KRG1_TOXGO|nr:putative transmembrane protein [Toxoplasma gondii GAB2-2007-GAL-DOM2]KFG46979.1 putative transmembrane protein [Toxoplasma gondii FOU]